VTWNIGLPPKDTVVALVVRKWVACESGLRTSFLARDPVLHISALGQAFANQEFEPTQTVRMGSLVEEDGELIVLDEDGDEADFEATAILAWSPVPSFAMDQAAAAETDLLLRRMADVAR
jgi:hypothetical protein